MTKQKASILVLCSLGLLMLSLFTSHSSFDAQSTPDFDTMIFVTSRFPAENYSYKINIFNTGEGIYDFHLFRAEYPNKGNDTLIIDGISLDTNDSISMPMRPINIPKSFEEAEMERLIPSKSELFHIKRRTSRKLLTPKDSLYRTILIPQIMNHLIDQQSTSKPSPTSP